MKVITLAKAQQVVTSIPLQECFVLLQDHRENDSFCIFMCIFMWSLQREKKGKVSLQMAWRGVRDDVWLALLFFRFVCIVFFVFSALFSLLYLDHYFCGRASCDVLFCTPLSMTVVRMAQESKRDRKVCWWWATTESSVHSLWFSWETKTRSYRRRSRRSESMIPPDFKSSSDMIILCNDMDSISFSLKSQGREIFFPFPSLSATPCFLSKRPSLCLSKHDIPCSHKSCVYFTSHLFLWKDNLITFKKNKRCF